MRRMILPLLYVSNFSAQSAHRRQIAEYARLASLSSLAMAAPRLSGSARFALLS